MKFSGFLISCAMPAVSWPSDAIFSAWIRLAWAVFSSRNVASALSRAARISSISRAFSIAITAWAAKFCNRAICFSVNGRTSWR